MKKTKKQFERMNLYIDSDLSKAIAENAERDYLRKTTWVTQFLRKSLLGENNHMSNLQEDEC
jgi:predicted DNA-binding protein YlxM (UPF0122 family)